MDVDERMKLIMSVGEEVVTEGELRELLERKAHPIAYDGFEPSGRMHIAQGLLRAATVNTLVKAGVRFKLYAADWHGWANNKMGGDLEAIQRVGDYMVEVWKACGMEKVEFVRASDVISGPSYWKTVMRVARAATLKRVLRTVEIMGRAESDTLSASQVLYPCMQAADVFELEADITQLGMDQRKVNMLAREVGPELGFWKPVVVSHRMLAGLQAPAATGTAEERALANKMSKSRPESAVFMTDSAAEVERKLNGAFCPAKQVEGNPVLEYCRYIIFARQPQLRIERDRKFGGDVTFKSAAELEAAFAAGLHPMDLKKATAAALNELLEPVRKHFAKGRARELLEFVEAQKVTR